MRLIHNNRVLVISVFLLALIGRLIALFVVEPISNPQTWEYEEMANNLYLSMQRVECLLPPIRDLQVHIHIIRKITTASKKSRYDCDSNTKHHADRFFSLCLALHAVGLGKNKDFYAQWQEAQQKGILPKPTKK